MVTHTGNTLKRRQAEAGDRSIGPHQWATNLLYMGDFWKVLLEGTKGKRGFSDLPERKSLCVQTLPLEDITTGHTLAKKYFFIPKAMTI